MSGHRRSVAAGGGAVASGFFAHPFLRHTASVSHATDLPSSTHRDHRSVLVPLGQAKILSHHHLGVQDTASAMGGQVADDVGARVAAFGSHGVYHCSARCGGLQANRSGEIPSTLAPMTEDLGTTVATTSQQQRKTGARQLNLWPRTVRDAPPLAVPRKSGDVAKNLALACCASRMQQDAGCGSKIEEPVATAAPGPGRCPAKQALAGVPQAATAAAAKVREAVAVPGGFATREYWEEEYAKAKDAPFEWCVCPGRGVDVCVL